MDENVICFSFNQVSLGSPDDLNDNGSESPNSSAKKATTRRNAWGNMSYADLITQAILNSPEKRLTLSQVYEWMVCDIIQPMLTNIYLIFIGSKCTLFPR